MVCAGYTVRDQLQVMPCGPTAVPRLRKSPREEGMAHMMLPSVGCPMAALPAAAVYSWGTGRACGAVHYAAASP